MWIIHVSSKFLFSMQKLMIDTHGKNSTGIGNSSSPSSNLTNNDHNVLAAAKLRRQVELFDVSGKVGFNVVNFCSIFFFSSFVSF